MTALSIHENQDLFSRLTLFWGVSYHSVEMYLQNCIEMELPAGHILLSPDMTNKNIYILLSGALNIHLDALGNDPIFTLDVGECVGEMSLIDHEVPSAFVVTAEPSRLLEIDKETLWGLVNASHGVATNLLLILSRRLRSGNRIIADSIEIRREIEEMAMIDPLTGLHNRRWLDNMLERLLNRSSMDDTPLTVIMADIDLFKPFNDHFGHLAGDRVLKVVAHTMRDMLRPSDMIARFGGEEFTILMPDTNIKDGFEVAERLRRRVKETVVSNTVDDVQLPTVTVSLGLAERQGDASVEKLLTAADEAMYRAKKEGRNRTSL